MSDDSLEIVHVTWIDSNSYGGWREKMKIEQMIIGVHDLACHSVGYLLSRDHDAVVIAQSVTGGKESYADIMKIPMVAVESIETIGEAEWQTKNE